MQHLNKASKHKLSASHREVIIGETLLNSVIQHNNRNKNNPNQHIAISPSSPLTLLPGLELQYSTIARARKPDPNTSHYITLAFQSSQQCVNASTLFSRINIPNAPPPLSITYGTVIIPYHYDDDTITSYNQQHIWYMGGAPSYRISRVMHESPSSHICRSYKYSVLTSELPHLATLPPFPHSTKPPKFSIKQRTHVMNICTHCFHQGHSKKGCPNKHMKNAQATNETNIHACIKCAKFDHHAGDRQCRAILCPICNKHAHAIPNCALFKNVYTPLTTENAKQPYETSDRHRNVNIQQHQNAWQNNQAINTIKQTLSNSTHNNQNNNSNMQSSDVLVMLMQQMLQQQQQFMQTMEQRYESMLTLLLSHIPKTSAAAMPTSTFPAAAASLSGSVQIIPAAPATGLPPNTSTSTSALLSPSRNARHRRAQSGPQPKHRSQLQPSIVSVLQAQKQSATITSTHTAAPTTMPISFQDIQDIDTIPDSDSGSDIDCSLADTAAQSIEPTSTDHRTRTRHSVLHQEFDARDRSKIVCIIDKRQTKEDDRITEYFCEWKLINPNLNPDLDTPEPSWQQQTDKYGNYITPKLIAQYEKRQKQTIQQTSTAPIVSTNTYHALSEDPEQANNDDDDSFEQKSNEYEKATPGYDYNNNIQLQLHNAYTPHKSNTSKRARSSSTPEADTTNESPSVEHPTSARDLSERFNKRTKAATNTPSHSKGISMDITPTQQ